MALALWKSKRLLTRRQREASWSAFTKWLRKKTPIPEISVPVCLEFLTQLQEKGFAAGTVKAYKNSLTVPWRLLNVNSSSWEFSDMIKSTFIENPPIRKYVPKWELEKVIDLLRSPKFSVNPSDFARLQKTLLLVSIATGNRSSELAAIESSSIQTDHRGARMAVRPGFIYKNQTQSRTPPVIEFPRLPENLSLCPVKNLEDYLKFHNIINGPLFRNSKTKAPLNAGSIAHILCKLIDEADPGKFPRAHDVRKRAASLAWARGVPITEICSRAFWASSTTFINRYLHTVPDEISLIALSSVDTKAHVKA